MSQAREFYTWLAREYDVPTPDFTAWDVAEVSPVNPCKAALEYFRGCVPVVTMDLEFVRVLGPEHLRMENLELLPGCHVAPFGFVTFAVSDTGNSVSMDVATGRVYPVAVDNFDREGVIFRGWKPDGTGFYPDVPMSREGILAVVGDGWPDVAAAFEGIFGGQEEDDE